MSAHHAAATCSRSVGTARPARSDARTASATDDPSACCAPGLPADWRGDRAGDELDADRLERRGRQRLRGSAGPERMAIAADDREAADALLAHEVEDLRALAHVAAPVAAAERRIARRRATGSSQRRTAGSADRCASRACRASCPRSSRLPSSSELLLEPLLLRGAEHAVRRRILARVRELLPAEADRRRRLPVGVRAARVEDLVHFLGHEVRIVLAAERIGGRRVHRAFRLERMLVGEHEVDVAAEAQAPIDVQAVDRREIVRLLADAVLVEALDGCVDDLGRREPFDLATVRLADARRLEFEPRLVRRDLARLRRASRPRRSSRSPASRATRTRDCPRRTRMASARGRPADLDPADSRDTRRGSHRASRARGSRAPCRRV